MATTHAPPVRSWLEHSADPDNVVVNIGPSHPATHGTIQIVAELDGETVKRADVHCGYLHRGFEKESEHHTYHKVIPYTDRLNYCSALNNNFVFADTVEKLLGLEITPRCKVLRTLLCEYSRIADHLTCIAASVMEMGAMTAFLYMMTVRDYIYEHLNHLTGARLTHSYVRIGGLARDLPQGWLERLEEVLKFTEEYVARIHGLLDRNRIFIDRTRNVAKMTTAHALNWGYTGPILRSTGLADGPAQGRALSGVRRAGLRSARRHQGRQLRPVLRAHVRDRRVDLDDPAVRAPVARRARSMSTTGA